MNPYAAPQASVAGTAPSRRGRKLLYFAIAVVLLLGVVFSLGNRGDATTSAKIAEVFLLLNMPREALGERCKQNTLVAGATNKSLGLPDPYPRGRLVKDVQVKGEAAGAFLVTVTLNDIYFEPLVFWRRLDIPAGSTMVLAGGCENGFATWRVRETSFPPRHLPSNYRPGAPR